jgi:hypothetical protein
MGYMSERVVIFDSPATGEKYEIDLPLSTNREPSMLREDLCLPGYIDTSESHVERALAVLWAARRADALAASHPELGKVRRPLDVCIFGGVGYRFLCPSANEDPVFCRQPGDLDLITTRSDGDSVVKLFCSLAAVLGSRYWHVVTKSDEMFNNLRAGRRFRIHGLRESDGSSTPDLATLDILVDQISFCHTVPAKAALANPADSLFTIGAAQLLLTKLQFIKAIPESEDIATHEHRIVGRLGGKVLIGPEDKDLADAAALLHDRGVGTEDLQIDPDVVIELLSADWGFAETVSLNLANRASFDHVLESRGATTTVIDRVRSQVETLAEIVKTAQTRSRRPRFRVSKTWWDEVDDPGA